jgi:putative flavoprotein involved in K+ transport
VTIASRVELRLVNQKEAQMSVQTETEGGTTTGLETFETVVIGGGQAGLSTGYFLSKLGCPFVILEAGERIGDSWRGRWDSMRLFTPARRDGLPGMPFPAPKHSFPTRDEMADYLEEYAARLELPVRTGVRVDALGRSDDGRFLIAAGEQRFEAAHVVIATGPFQAPSLPEFADQLDPRIVQLHSSQYRNPAELPEGDVLVVGPGNSGADIALELAAERSVRLSGELGSEIPFDIEGRSGRLIFPLLWQVWTHVLSFGNPIGRRALPKIKAGKEPLIRVKRRWLERAGVQFVPRTVGVHDGVPVLEDGTKVEAPVVIWCTGYHASHEWIDLPVLDEEADLASDHRGVVAEEPGLYRVGRAFLYAFNSHTIGGVGRDARRIAKRIASGRSHQATGDESVPAAGRRG